MNDLQRSRLAQAKEALDEARSLLAGGMDIGFVLNNIYCAFYHSVIALVHGGQVPDVMQRVTIGLFEQRFVRTGAITPDFLEALERTFELKPKCGTGASAVSRDEIERLVEQAASFIVAAGGVAVRQSEQ
jgi:uncharacterized protein (UPF0332 family)